MMRSGSCKLCADIAAGLAIAALLCGSSFQTAVAQPADTESSVPMQLRPAAAEPETATPPPPAEGTVAAPAQATQGGGAVQGPTGSFAGLSKNSDQPIDIESDLLFVHDSQKYATFKGNVKAVQGTTTLRAEILDVHYLGGGTDSLAGPGAKDKGKAAAPAAAAGNPADPEQTAARKVASADPQAGAPASAPAAAAATPAKQPPAAAASGGVGLGDNGTKITKIYAKEHVVIVSEDQTTTGDWALYDVPGQMVTVGGNVVLTQGKNVLKGERLVIDLTTGESRFENPGNATEGKRIRALFMPKQDAGSGDAKSDDGKSSDEKSSDDQKSGAETAETSGATGEAPEQAPAKGAPAKAAPAPDDSSPWQLIPGNPQ